MSNENYIYHEAFPKGSKVKIQNQPFLEDFLRSWTLHNKLNPEQLDYAGQVAEVETVGFYHGGDELYKLKNIPGIWHKQCLEAYAPA